MTYQTPEFDDLRILCALWGQNRLMRTFIWIYSRRESLSQLKTNNLALMSLIAGVLATAFPGSPTLLLVLGTTLAHDWAIAPYDLDNGTTYEIWVAMFLLTGTLYSLLSGQPSQVGILQGAAFVRPCFSLVYVFSVFAKLNYDYMDLRKSSNTVFNVLVLGGSASPDMFSDRGWWRCFTATLMTLQTVETSIPILFWSRMTSAGVAMAWIYHISTGAIAFDSSIAYMATLPLWFPERLNELRFMTTHPAARVVNFGVVVLLCSRLPQRSAIVSPVHAVWLFWSLCLAFGLSQAAYNTEPADVWPQEAFPDGWSLYSVYGSGAVLLFIFSGMSIYLGIKTHSTFTTFSNLRVEGGKTNHLIWRPWMAPFSNLHDLVTITDTDLPKLRYFMQSVGDPGTLAPLAQRLGLRSTVYSNNPVSLLDETADLRASFPPQHVFPFRIPYIELRCVISETLDKTFFVDFKRGGGTARFQKIQGKIEPGSDMRLSETLWPRAVRKWMFCRALHVDDNQCGVCCH